MSTVIPLTDVLTDRSRIVADWKCPRARYWQYEHAGKGVVGSTTSLELWLGTAIHDALAAAARCQLAGGTVEVEVIVTEAARAVFNSLTAATAGELDADAHTFACEQSALVEGLLRGFFRSQWPRLLEGKRIISIEEEMTFRLPNGITFMSKPDLILEDESDGEWEYKEYKSTSSKKTAWVNSWTTAVQLHSTVKAVGATKGREPSRVSVAGLYKGYESYGRQNSPFCYAYVRDGQPPFRAESVRYDYAAGYRRQPVWERPGGVRAWVEGMPDDMLADQFPQAPPIFVREHLVAAFFRQTAEREAAIAQAAARLRETSCEGTEREGLLDAVFPQHFEHCSPAWGRGCGYKRLCHGVVSFDDEGLPEGFMWREPHHQPELDAQEGEA